MPDTDACMLERRDIAIQLWLYNSLFKMGAQKYRKLLKWFLNWADKNGYLKNTRMMNALCRW